MSEYNPCGERQYRSPRFFCASGVIEQAPSLCQTEESTRPPRKCHRQVIDLMRSCLVFGLPLPWRRSRARMILMSRFRRPATRRFGRSLLSLCCGCCRPAGLRSDDAAPGGPASGSFPGRQRSRLGSCLSAASQTQADSAEVRAPCPFAITQNLPAGNSADGSAEESYLCRESCAKRHLRGRRG